MESVYLLLFGWCSTDSQFLFALFIYIVIVQAVFNFILGLIKDVRRL